MSIELRWSNNFSGSVLLLELQGIMSGSPTFKGQHLINAVILISIIFNLFTLFNAVSDLFWILLTVSLIGFLLIIPIGGADVQVVIDA